MFLSAGRVFAVHNVSSFRPNAIYVALVHQVAFEDVVFAPNDDVLPQRFVNVEYGGERLVGDMHQFPGASQQVFILMRYEENRLMLVID